MSSPAINLFFTLFSFLIFSISSSLPLSQTKKPTTVQTLNVAAAAEIKMVNPKLPPRSLSLTSSKRYEGSSDLVHLRYHMGPVLSSSPINIYVIWYGRWSRPHKALIRDFLNSISDAKAPSPSVAEWWRTATLYTDQTGANVSRSVLIAGEYSDAKYSTDRASRASRSKKSSPAPRDPLPSRWTTRTGCTSC
ncbi:Protein EXORDIUM-like 5 [Raphanus sativus]|nr:Protein EXORDIUM-like 5 [Raphanus sativus]